MIFAEEKQIKVRKGSAIFDSMLRFYENSPNDSEKAFIGLTFDDQNFICESDNLFRALQDLRRKLETVNIQILCNGAAKNVYPSPMLMGMGPCRKAFKLQCGRPAKMSDLIEIFDFDETLEFTDVDTQNAFYSHWVKSLQHCPPQ